MRGIESARQARSAGSSADAAEDGSHGASLLYLRTMPESLWCAYVKGNAKIIYWKSPSTGILPYTAMNLNSMS